MAYPEFGLCTWDPEFELFMVYTWTRIISLTGKRPANLKFLAEVLCRIITAWSRVPYYKWRASVPVTACHASRPGVYYVPINYMQTILVSKCLKGFESGPNDAPIRSKSWMDLDHISNISLDVFDIWYISEMWLLLWWDPWNIVYMVYPVYI